MRFEVAKVGVDGMTISFPDKPLKLRHRLHAKGLEGTGRDPSSAHFQHAAKGGTHPLTNNVIYRCGWLLWLFFNLDDARHLGSRCKVEHRPPSVV